MGGGGASTLLLGEQGSLNNIGGMNAAYARGMLKTQDPAFKQLERVAQKVREEDLEYQL